MNAELLRKLGYKPVFQCPYQLEHILLNGDNK